MPVDIIVPEVGEVGMEVTLVAWLKEEGDSVREGEPLFQLDTQKTLLDVESVGSGILSAVLAQPGDLVEPHRVIARLLAPGEDARALEVESPVASPAARVDLPRSTADRTVPGESPPGAGVSPRARRLARELGIELDGLGGTGAGGLITEADVRAASPTRDAPISDDTDRRRERTRQAVATMTSRSWRDAPHFYLSLDADLTEGMRIARPTTLICAAIARGLRDHPECNLEWTDGDLVSRGTIDLGILVDTPVGLILPSVRAADTLGASDLTDAIAAAADRARRGTLHADDFGARSLSVSNLGMYAVDAFAGVIAVPDPMLVAVGRARQEARWDGSAWRPASIATITLSVDHRALDGAAAARFLTTIERLLGDPSWLS